MLNDKKNSKGPLGQVAEFVFLEHVCGFESLLTYRTK